MNHPTFYRTINSDGLSDFYRKTGLKDAPTPPACWMDFHASGLWSRGFGMNIIVVAHAYPRFWTQRVAGC